MLTDITDTEGKYSFTNLATGYYTVEMSKAGYLPMRFNVSLEEGTNDPKNGYLSLDNLETPNDFRVVLTWGIYPTDLDSHLYGKLPQTLCMYTMRTRLTLSAEKVSNLIVMM